MKILKTPTLYFEFSDNKKNRKVECHAGLTSSEVSVKKIIKEKTSQ